MEVYLNELSLPQLNRPEEVQILFGNLKIVYEKINGYGVSAIKIKADFLNHQFTNLYTFESWINDPNTDADLRTLLVGVLTTDPFVDQIFYDHEKKTKRAIEFYVLERNCFGFGLASNLVTNTLGVSLDLDGQTWSDAQYNVQAKYVEEDEEGNLVEILENGISKNISTKNHCEIHKDFVERKVKASVISGRSLWQRKSELLPNIEFCEEVYSQILDLKSSHHEFGQILNRLFELNEFGNRWDGSPIKPEDFATKASPESDTRRKKLVSKLTKNCPDNIERFFDWHLRYTPGAGRIYFFPLPEKKKFIIGYIGAKIT